MSSNIASFILRHVHADGTYGFPCQSTFYVNDDKTVTIRTIMNDMGSDGMWEETRNVTVPIADARTLWRTWKAYSWAPRS